MGVGGGKGPKGIPAGMKTKGYSKAGKPKKKK